MKVSEGEKYGYSTPMLVPKLDKIVVNMGVGDATVNSKNLENAVKELEKIIKEEKLPEWFNKKIDKQTASLEEQVAMQDLLKEYIPTSTTTPTTGA